MIEAGESLSNVARYGEFDGALAVDVVVVPPEADAAKYMSVPVCYCFVLFFEVVNQVKAVLEVDVLHTEVMYYKVELDRFRPVFEDAGGDTSGDITAKG